jgi:hypothetical protein
MVVDYQVCGVSDVAEHLAELEMGLVELKHRFKQLSNESYFVMKAIELTEAVIKEPDPGKVAFALGVIEQIRTSDHPSLDMTKDTNVAPEITKEPALEVP